MNLLPITVLMSVYVNEQASFFLESINSILKQKSLPKEIVLVKDGPLTSELEQAISKCKSICQREGVALIIKSLIKNGGLGKALAFGLENCSYNIIARMDTDDVSKKDRLLLQYEFLNSHSEISVVGTQIAEFIDNTTHIVSHRVVPTDPVKVRKFSNTRNPINHMSVMFKKDEIQSVGGYQTCPGFEDYFLWLRVLKKNPLCVANMKETLVFARVDDLSERRGGVNYLKKSIKARTLFLSNGLISFFGYVKSISVSLIFSILSNKTRKQFYKIFLRK